MPGGLRYAIARALLDVDAPPFDSLADFSATLGRFEQGDRRLVLRLLAHRAGLVEERRMLTAMPPRLRPNAASRSSAVPSVKRVPAVAAGLVAGLSLIGIGEGMHLLHAPVHAVLHRVATQGVSRDEAAARTASPSSVPASANPVATNPQPSRTSTPAAAAAPVAPHRPATVAHRRRAVKIARADVPVRASDARAHVRNRHDAEAHSIFGIRFKWGGDTFAHR
jgi:hypothetical protein